MGEFELLVGRRWFRVSVTSLDVLQDALRPLGKAPVTAQLHGRDEGELAPAWSGELVMRRVDDNTLHIGVSSVPERFVLTTTLLDAGLVELFEPEDGTPRALVRTGQVCFVMQATVDAPRSR